MKTRKSGFFAAALLVGASVSFAFAQQDAEEVPGDNFSLEGALELFKKSESPQQFEQLLNSPDSKVNNLDLNGDGDIDYIRVIDKNEGNVHAFILQSIIAKDEFQDIAVIELEKRGDGSAVLQIVGDADIYGIETIIEPTSEVRVNAGASTARTTVNVWAWPSVQYVYGPYYNVWASPWYWGYYPGWYRPWRPVAYYVYNPWWAPYRPYYSICYSHRVFYAHRMYRPYRTSSVIVYNRHHTVVNNYRSSGRGYRWDTSPSRSSRYDSRTGHVSSSYSRGDRYTNGSGSRHTMESNSRSGRTGYSRTNNDSYSRSSRRSENNSTVTTPSGNQSRTRSSGSYERRSTGSSDRTFSSPNRSSGSSDRTFSSPGRNSGSQGRTSMNQQRSQPSFNGGSQSGGSRMSAPSRSGGGSSPSFRSAPSHSAPRSGGGGQSGGGGRSGGGGGGSQSGGRSGRHN